MLSNIRSYASRPWQVSAMIGMAAAIAWSGPAAAITSSSFTYNSAKSAYYSISSLAMIPDSDGTYTSNHSSGRISSPSGLCFSTGIRLPQGAIIRNLVVWVSSGTGSTPVVTLHRERLTDGQVSYIYSTAIFSDNLNRTKFTYTAIPADKRQIKNGEYAYGFAICPGTDGIFYQARINYTYTNAGD